LGHPCKAKKREKKSIKNRSKFEYDKFFEKVEYDKLHRCNDA
jgi:hypothetical protein